MNKNSTSRFNSFYTILSLVIIALVFIIIFFAIRFVITRFLFPLWPYITVFVVLYLAYQVLFHTKKTQEKITSFYCMIRKKISDLDHEI